MASINLKLELARIVEGLSIAQKKGCFNLDEAAMVHSAIVSIQKANLVEADSVTPSEKAKPPEEFIQEKEQWNKDKTILLQQRQQLVTEREQLVALLEEYRKAIEEFKKKHDEQIFQLNVANEKIKDLKVQMNVFEKENIDLRNDLSELVNADIEEVKDEVIPVVKTKPRKKKITP